MFIKWINKNKNVHWKWNMIAIYIDRIIVDKFLYLQSCVLQNLHNMMAMNINETTQSTVHVLTELDPGKS